MAHPLEAELRRLFDVLRAHPGGLREYEILEILRGAHPLRGLDELGLFRVHFLLFHHLYRLRAALAARGMGHLEIHCLRIRWLPLEAQAPPNPEALPLEPDPLASYYLEAENLARTTREEVRDLLAWFWRRYRLYGRQKEALEALETLGLSSAASSDEVRRRFRKLARIHHPDAGGDAEVFRRVAGAAQVLRLLLP